VLPPPRRRQARRRPRPARPRGGGGRAVERGRRRGHRRELRRRAVPEGPRAGAAHPPGPLGAGGRLRGRPGRGAGLAPPRAPFPSSLLARIQVIHMKHTESTTHPTTLAGARPARTAALAALLVSAWLAPAAAQAGLIVTITA